MLSNKTTQINTCSIAQTYILNHLHSHYSTNYPRDNNYHECHKILIFNDSIYLFLKRGEGREKEREINIHVWLPLAHPKLGTWPATQAYALTGNQTNDLLVCRLAFNPLSHTSQRTRFYNKIFIGTFV